MKSIYGAGFWSVFHEAEDCLSVCLSVYLSVAVCRSEINLGVGATGFTLVKYYRPSADKNSFIRVYVCLSVCSFVVVICHSELLINAPGVYWRPGVY